MTTRRPHSHAEPADLPCLQCGERSYAEVWIIVDADERPDLLARIRAGTLHEIACPHCGHKATINAPLLIVRPRARPVLLFSPAAGQTHAQDDEQAAALVGMLREHAGDGWRDEWLGEGVAGITRAALPAALGEDPQTVAGLAAAATAAEEVRPEVRRALEDILRLLSAEGVRVDTPEELARAVAARPELRAALEAALGGAAGGDPTERPG